MNHDEFLAKFVDCHSSEQFQNRYISICREANNEQEQQLFRHYFRQLLDNLESETSIVDIPDYARFRQDNKVYEWRQFWNKAKPYGQNVIDLLNRCVLLPEHELMCKVISAFNAQLLPILEKSNILALVGQSGSGKSTVCELLSCLQQIPPIQANSSIVSWRNFMNSARVFGDIHGKNAGLECNLVLYLDDFSADIIKDDKVYSILKPYSRQSAWITVSTLGGEQGENARFNVFALKVLTTTANILNHPKFRELQRRCFFIPTKSSLAGDREFLSTSEVNWNQVQREFYRLWNKRALNDYHEYNRRLKRPSAIDVKQWDISKSLIISGIIAGVWEHEHQAINDMVVYWDELTKERAARQSPVEGCLLKFIRDWNIEDDKERFPENCIQPRYFDKYLELAFKNHELNLKPNAKVRHDALLALGFTMKRLNNVMYYVPED